MEALGGAKLFKYYPSLGEALQALYPDSEWDTSRFKQLPRGFWDDPANVGKALDMAETKLGIEKVSPLSASPLPLPQPHRKEHQNFS